MSDNSLLDIEIRLRRLKFRSWHRGIKEMDLILGHFADQILPTLTPIELDLYEALIEVEDTSLYNWVTGRENAPDEFDTPMLTRIRSFDYMKGTLWQR